MDNIYSMGLELDNEGRVNSHKKNFEILNTGLYVLYKLSHNYLNALEFVSLLKDELNW